MVKSTGETIVGKKKPGILLLSSELQRGGHLEEVAGWGGAGGLGEGAGEEVGVGEIGELFARNYLPGIMQPSTCGKALSFSV